MKFNSKLNTPIRKKITDTLESLFVHNSFLILGLTIFSLLLFLYWDYISLQNTFMFNDVGSDTIGLFYPNFVCISDYIQKHGIPSWSFQQGLGQNLFPLNCGDPFSAILFSSNRTIIPYMIVFVELLKIILISIFSFSLLKKRNLPPDICLIGACIIAFSGFVILGGTWYCFSTEAFLFVFIINAFENIYRNKRNYTFTIAIFLIASYQPVSLFIIGIFLCFYITIRFVSENEFQFPRLKKCISNILLYGIIGIGISAIFSFPTIFQLAHSTRVTGESSLFKQLTSQGIITESKEYYFTTLMRFFSNDILGGGIEYFGWNNYLEAPLFYCSLPILLLIPQVFFGTSTRLKILYASTLFLLVITIVFPFFRQAFWLYSGNYFRFYSFGLMFLVLIIALQALKQIYNTRKIHVPTLVISLLFLLLILYSSFYFKIEPIKEIRNIVTILLCLYSIYFFLFQYKTTQIIGKLLFFITLCFELFYMSNKPINNRSRIASSDLKTKTLYNDYFVEANNYIKSNDRSFYRINKTYLSRINTNYSTQNDPKIQDFRGGTNYSSFNQFQYISFFNATEGQNKMKDASSRFCYGYFFRPILQILCNVKYTVSKGPVSELIAKTNDSVTTFQDVSIWKNRLFLPMGFTYSNFMSMNEFKKLSINKKDNALLNCFILDSVNTLNTQGLRHLNAENVLDTIMVDSISKYVKARKEDTLQIHSFNETDFDGTISLKTKKLLFLSIPNDEGWHAIIDGKEQAITTVSAGMMGIILEKGYHTVKLEFIRPYFKLGILVSLCFLVLLIVILIQIKRNVQA